MPQTVVFGGLGGVERTHHHRFHHHVARRQWFRFLAVLVHHPRQQRLVQRTPVHADPHRLMVFDCALHHDAEIVVVLAPHRHVAGIDAVLGQRARRGWILLEQQMPVVVEVAHDRHRHAALVQALHNRRHSGRGVLVVHRDAHNLRTRRRQRRNLLDGSRNVGRVGVGHRLHHHRNLPAHAYLPDFDRWRFPAMNFSHTSSLPAIWPTATP